MNSKLRETDRESLTWIIAEPERDPEIIDEDRHRWKKSPTKRNLDRRAEISGKLKIRAAKQ